MEISDILAMVISAAALLFSVFTWWSNQRQAARSRKREYLEDFLRPIRSILNLNRSTHRALVTDTRLRQLEFAPDYVQQALHASLDPDDPRRVIWRAEISRLMDENGKAVELVERHLGRVEREELRSSLEDYKRHALDWQAMWQAVLDPDPELVEGYRGAGRLETEPFPTELDALLEEEIALAEAAVGVKKQ